MSALARVLSLLLALAPAALPAAFDHTHAAWDRLLSEHVVWVRGGVASRVDYAGFQRDRTALQGYLAALSAVRPETFQGWSRDRRLAFLINAYNAFTVELILTGYPDIDSIKDLGGFFSSPWKQRFFTLLGGRRHLDWIEHERIREPGVYDEPRIHFAVNCASIGCPALRPEAFVAERLDAQLADSTGRFLADRTRNRYEPETDTLRVSSIFDWYAEDFERGWRGIDSVREFLAAHAVRLADGPEHRARIRAGRTDLGYLAYDWALNDTATLPAAAAHRSAPPFDGQR